MRDLKEFTAKCKSLLEQGYYEEVIRASLDRLAAFPDDPEAILFMAEARLVKNEIADAKGLLAPLCDRLLVLSSAFKLLGDAYYKDNPEMGREYYRKYMALAPESEAAVRLHAQLDVDNLTDNEDQLQPGFRTLTMADLMIKQGHIETAREILEEIIGREPENSQALERFGKIQVIQSLEKWRKGLSRRKSDN